MSWMPAPEPECHEDRDHAVAQLIEPREKDLGDGFVVRRVLPAKRRRMVGPFIFWDEMGPVTFAPGQGLDVRPHPHIGLATLTYLFEGEIFHRDSLGTAVAIRPGEVNWMTAGRGVTHSERTRDEVRERGGRVHGIQSWIALPEAHEDDEPWFAHHDAEALPELERDGATLRVIAGDVYGKRSPLKTLSPMFYVDAKLPEGTQLPLPDGPTERAAYVVAGEVAVNGERHGPGRMLVFEPGHARIEAKSESRVMLLGGEPLGPRHIEWNFVASSKERIAAARDAWSAEDTARFPLVPGDEAERIPYP
ncbi:MAG: pirin family protein [Myxococcota bacterium]|nr:pirin family protein [Myxococcota bacterium]